METRYYPQLPKYQTLEEIPLPPYTEPKIANLVRALISIRVDVHGSGEGHLAYRCGHQHPWVSFNPFSVAKVAALKYLVEKYNKDQDHKIKWEIENAWLIPSTYEELFKCCDERREGRMSRKKLEQLQQSADELARYIFDNRANENIIKLILVYGL